MSVSLRSNINTWKKLTVARLIYSLSTGFPDCSKLSTIKVKGETCSRCDNSFEINSKLCVRRCCNVVGAMLKSFYDSGLLLYDHFCTQAVGIFFVSLMVSGWMLWELEIKIVLLMFELASIWSQKELILVAARVARITLRTCHVANNHFCIEMHKWHRSRQQYLMLQRWSINVTLDEKHFVVCAYIRDLSIIGEPMWELAYCLDASSSTHFAAWTRLNSRKSWMCSS